MAKLRIPLVALMGAVAIIALDMAIFSSLYRSNPFLVLSPGVHVQLFVFAFGVLPLASLLIFVALVRLPHIVLRRVDAPFFFGFEVFGWGTIFLFILIAALSPKSVAAYFESMFRVADLILVPLARSFNSQAKRPLWLDMVLEWIFEAGPLTLFFAVPEVLFALLGGWVARKIGISVRVELRRAVPTQPDPEAVAGPDRDLFFGRT